MASAATLLRMAGNSGRIVTSGNRLLSLSYHSAHRAPASIFVAVRSNSSLKLRRIMTSSPASAASPLPSQPLSDVPEQAGPQRLFQPHLNYRRLRQDISQLADNIKTRRIEHIDLDHISALSEQVLKTEFQVASTRKRRNEIATEIASIVKQIASIKKSRSKPQVAAAAAEDLQRLESQRLSLTDEGRTIKSNLQKIEEHLSKIHTELFEEARHLPNDTHPSVPIGDESKAIVVSTHGTPLTAFPNDALDHSKPLRLRTHLEIAAIHDMLDIDRAGKVSGSRFYFLKNAGALLELALVRYATDVCLSHGFEPVITPDIIRQEVLEACGFSPRSDDPQTYFLSTAATTAPSTSGNSHADDGTVSTLVPPHRNPMTMCLSATAEFPLAGMYAGETISQLPVKMVGMGHAFRAEGLAGSTNRGLYRVHQFTKVEMFALTSPAEKTHQMPDGSIRIPNKLRPYFLGSHVDLLPANVAFSDLIKQARLKTA
eukprot:jgi/Hompol1/5513/HPOL_002268-RA